QIPRLKEVETWRKLVPSDFRFAVRAHQTMLQMGKPKWIQKATVAFDRIKQTCEALRSDLLHVQVPNSFGFSQKGIDEFRSFVSSIDIGKLRLALEYRGVRPSKLPPEFVRLMQDHDFVHCIDVSKGEMPAYDSDILYTRLFGKGEHNIYQPTDEELTEIDNKVSNSNSKKIVMSFHFVRMYKDAARLKIYKESGKFPKVTRLTGLASLEEVLSEDATFPASKQELMRSQGWKLFDLTEDKRVHARDLLQNLAERTYQNLDRVIQGLKSGVR
ncbi:MAG TPA: DUF72 domain-containing protein, partial [Candidatus Acidoferrum sp.]|nr:DUF72 domain-containing protein [Candidatus Acidoferrum sp.]